jgi:hypothetical protein
VRGVEQGSGFGATTHGIEISMREYEATVGIKYRFGGDERVPLK